MTHLTRSRSAALVLCAGLPLLAPAPAAEGYSTGFAPAAAAMARQPEGLDALMAPIALYPDALVLQILECSSSPDQIKKLSDWVKQNPEVKGSAAQDAVAAEGFDERFVAIVLFPQVVQKMNDDQAWTRDVAKAFADDRKGVFDSIQRLRKQAQSVGNLSSNEQQNVETVTTDSGTEVIVIQPANPQVVYVPQYTTVVYTQPPPPPSSGQTAGAALVGFTAGVIIGAAIADDDCGWGYHGSALCDEGYDEYTEHREDMAAQRGENQSGRQESRSENQSGREESRTENQGNRQESRGGESASGQGAGGQQAARGSANETRGAAPGASATSGQRSGTSSGAMSGYQSGSKEKQASSRGRSSTSKSSGARGGGSRGGGGGRGGGGRGR